MSDTFDPNSWPRSRNAGGAHASGAAAPKEATGQPRRTDDNDDFDALAFDANSDINLDDFADDDFETYSFDGQQPPATKSAATGATYDPSLDEDFDLGGATYPGAPAQPQNFEGYAPPSAPAAAPTNDDFDDDFGQDTYGNTSYGNTSYGNNDYDDSPYDDNFEDFEHQKEGRSKLKIAVGAAAALVLLSVGGVAIASSIGGDNTDSTQAAAGENAEAETEAEGGAETPEAEGSSAGPATAGEAGAMNSTAEPAPEEVLTGMNDAFEGWGKYAVSGNLNEVRPYFVQGQGQWARFETEGPEIAKSPPLGDPLSFDMTSYKAFKINDKDWLVQGPVVSSRPGSATENFRWEVRMVQEGDVWKIKSVRGI